MNEETKQKIENFLAENDIALFIKGDPNGPMCGFSGRVVQVLSEHKADFNHINVLEDHDIWQGIKEYGNWPTIPQLYVKGKLIGGCDIVLDLENSGELAEILKSN